MPNQPGGSTELLAVANSQSTDAGRIALPESLRGAHPLIRRARELLEKEKPATSGVVVAGWQEPCLRIRVSKPSLRRALLILQAIFAEMERRGCSVEVGKDRSSETVVIVGQERVSIAMSEKIDRAERARKEDEAGHSYLWNRYTYTPSGRLSFCVTEYHPSGARKAWNDGKRKRLEYQLDEIVAGLFVVAEGMKQTRLRWEEQQRRRQEEERRQRELERLRQAEAARCQKLEESAKQWAEANRLRDFVGACEAKLRSSGLPIDDGGPEAWWLAWARKHAGRLDPLGGDYLARAIHELPAPRAELPPLVP